MKRLLILLALVAALFATAATMGGFSDGGDKAQASVRPNGHPAIPPCRYDTGRQRDDICRVDSAPATATPIHVFARYYWFDGVRSQPCLSNQHDPCEMYVQKPNGELLIGSFEYAVRNTRIPGTHFWVAPGSWACCETDISYTSSYLCCAQIGAGNVDMWARKPCPYNGGFMYSPVRRYYFNGHEPSDLGITLDLGAQFLDSPQYACQPAGGGAD